MAAPTVGAVLEDILPYLGVEAEYTKQELYRVNIPMPDVVGLGVHAAEEKLKAESFSCRIIGNGDKGISQGNPFRAIPRCFCIQTIR